MAGNDEGSRKSESVVELGRALRAGEVTALQLAQRSLARVAERNAEVHAVLTVTADRAEADARRADDELARGHDRGPLHGIPYGLKDIIATRGIPTTCNSRAELATVPAVDAEVEHRLRAAGGVLVGKLNTAEFALGGGDDLPWPAARNPWNAEHFTGTSSTGSGAAVAAGMVSLAVGSDTGGSIRSPAALCGVVGLKPTYGRVSRRGLYPLSWSLDHAGPLGRTVEDVALALGVLAGHDPADPASADVPVADPLRTLQDGVQGVRVGYVRNWLTGPGGASDVVLSATDAAVERLACAGACVEEVSLPDFELFKACGRGGSSWCARRSPSTSSGRATTAGTPTSASFPQPGLARPICSRPSASAGN
jgi:aspartyl-tRNA(Asn)/glutamyl-tRNA(Gln) amidotransferase subunit A